MSKMSKMSKKNTETHTTETAAPVTTTTHTEGMSAAQAKKDGPGRPKIRWASPTNPNYWVRSFADVTGAWGPPRDPNGAEMVPQTRAVAGESKKQAKLEREALLRGMSDEARAEFLAKERQERKAAAERRKAAAEEALRAKYRAEFEAELAAGRS
jgi:hypothetical protein